MNMLNKRFGDLVVIKQDGMLRRYRAWLCKCDCGGSIRVTTGHLNSGHTRSCGCKKGNKQLDLKSKKFGHLLAIRPIGRAKGGVLWKCQCDCGEEANVVARSLKIGETTTCGCHMGRPIKHGHCVSKISNTYMVYAGMLERCTNKNNPNWHRYGGRGITVCDRWMTSFNNFLNDMGEKPNGMSIERIDNNQGYGPKNCRWATPKEQARNRRTTYKVNINGEVHSLAKWADIYHVPYWKAWQRINRGWSPEKALITM